MSMITINGISIDPSAQGPVLAAMNKIADDASASHYTLLQTTGPLTSAQREELNAREVQILEYVSENTYICRYIPNDLNVIRSLSFVEWANIYLRDFKIAPALLQAPETSGSSVRMELLALPNPPLTNAPKTIDIVVHNGVDPQVVRERIAAAAHVDPEDLQPGREKVRITTQARYLPEIAAIDDVRHIEEVIPRQLHNDVARTILRTDVVPNTGSAGAAFEGAGQSIVVTDTGFDHGDLNNVHPAFQGRVHKLYALGRPGKANDPHGHGTHVAGSALGDEHSQMLGSRIRGTAPKATLILQSVLDAQGGLGGLPDDLRDLFLPSYNQDNARIYTNSWGSTIGDGRYDSQAHEMDDFVWSHRDCVICFSAGNEGTDHSGTGRVAANSITPPGTAKNCITVGATESYRPEFNDTYKGFWGQHFPAHPIASDKLADNPQGMAAFSSRGPTRNERIKPDVVAPGTFILSTRSRAVASSNPGWAPSADPNYFFSGGTSMATPLVAGCVALIREYLNKRHGLAHPSAALVKAMLINGAQDIAGQYVPSESGNIPNGSEGFGLVNISATIGPVDPSTTLLIRDESTNLTVDQEETFTVPLATPTCSLKATLVWTDPAGEWLQNDLDLIVRTADGQERHGNQPPNSKSFDRVNNVEQVVWENISADHVEIAVRAYRITRFPQPYALVIRTI